MKSKKSLRLFFIILTCFSGGTSLISAYVSLLNPMKYYSLSLWKTALFSPLFHLSFGVCLAFLLTYCSNEPISFRPKHRIVVLFFSVVILLIHVLVRLMVYVPLFSFLRTLFGIWGCDIILKTPYMLEAVGIFFSLSLFDPSQTEQKSPS